MRRGLSLWTMFGFLLLFAAGGRVLYAQLEGADRGVPPVDSASTFEVTGIAVDIVADSAEKARTEGWRRAQSIGWKALWANTNGRSQSEAPSLSDSVLDSMVSGIIVEQEQIGPKRYIATLGILFDRARTGQLLGVSGTIRRSAPMLVIPVLLTGSTVQSFESRTEWQKAWARFRTGSSPIDYVRPTGSGVDPLLLNAAQSRRPGRGWWRLLLDQYGAADVIVPEVHLKRSYPGGPAIGTFVARHGPDNRILGSFSLRAGNSGAIPRMFDEGIKRLDALYARALQAGLLRPDPTLVIEEPQIVEAIEEDAAEDTLASVAPAAAAPTGAITTFAIQVPTPGAAAVQQAEISVSRIPGVTSAITTSLALGSTSVMRVTYAGDSAAFRTALAAQGWQVSGSGTSLRISRGGGQ